MHRLAIRAGLTLAATIVSLIAASSALAREHRFRDVPFEVRPGDRFAIVGIRGSLRLQPPAVAAGSQGVLRVRKTSPDGGTDTRFDQLGFTLRREGSVIRIEPAGIDGAKANWVEISRAPGLELSFDIEAPAIAADIAWRSGQVSLVGWRGAVSVDLVEGGFLSRQTEGAFRVQIQRGDVKVESHRGRLDLTSHVARLAATRIEGDIEAESIGGEVALEGVRGTVFLRGFSAPVNVAKSSGSLDFESTRAAITIGNFEGPVRGQSDEGALDLQVDGEPDVNVESVKAAIGIRLSGRAGGASVKASTEEGQLVVPDPPLKVNKQPGIKLVSGRLPGAGQGTVFAKSKSGSIRIR